MPSDLKNLELDEVSLVGKAANNRKFLIFKSMNNPKGRITMNDHKPAGARAGAGEAQVITKADIADMIAKGIDAGVRKAVAPIIDENKRLHKTQKGLVDSLRSRDLELIAKSELGELGKPADISKILKSLEDSNLPAKDQERIVATLKQANAMKKEAGKLLYNPFGSSQPAPGSATEQFNALIEKHLGEIRKGDTGNKSAKVLRARAVTKAAEENPQLAKAVMVEHRQNVHAAFIGGRQ